MGQNQSETNGVIEQITKKWIQDQQISTILEKTINQHSSTKISFNQAELYIDTHDQNSQQILKFVADHPFEEFEHYQGKGKIYNHDGFKIFQGNFHNGKRKGFGIEYNDDKQIIYEGFFKDNAHHGWGVTHDYQGQFSKGQKSGWGKYQSLDKNYEGQPSLFYEGFWLNNHCSGYGALNVKEKQVSDFLDCSKEVELGSYLYKYVGQWRFGKFSGIGKLVNKNEVYQGQFVNGVYEGKGVLSVKGKKPLKGQFLQGKIVGQ